MECDATESADVVIVATPEPLSVAVPKERCAIHEID